MKLTSIVTRSKSPIPWGDADNIPWNESGFSARMLREHLSQKHNLASRRFEIIDRHVDWIHGKILSGKPSKVLDLGCGPGFYTSRLAGLGHECTGIDYSPASIEYANQNNPGCTYHLRDIREGGYGADYDLVMLIFGEFNVFKPSDAKTILREANRALKPGGFLLLEVKILSVIKEIGEQSRYWYSAKRGTFSDEPFIVLRESYWLPEQNIATIRYHAIDASTGSVTEYSQSFQGYTDDDYRNVLNERGFGEIEFYPGFGEDEGDYTRGLMVIVCKA